MKAKRRIKPLTFGEFVTSVYDAGGGQKAEGMVRLAVNARLLEFRGPDRFVIVEPGPNQNLSFP